jgi:hypothetical protein
LELIKNIDYVLKTIDESKYMVMLLHDIDTDELSLLRNNFKNIVETFKIDYEKLITKEEIIKDNFSKCSQSHLEY